MILFDVIESMKSLTTILTFSFGYPINLLWWFYYLMNLHHAVMMAPKPSQKSFDIAFFLLTSGRSWGHWIVLDLPSAPSSTDLENFSLLFFFISQEPLPLVEKYFQIHGNTCTFHSQSWRVNKFTYIDHTRL
jgi:hypothetical protein